MQELDLSGWQVSGHLLDMDGVLIESAHDQTVGWTEWAESHGLDPAPFIDAHGRRAVDKIRDLAPHLDAPGEARIVSQLEVAAVRDVRALPGAREMLQDGGCAIVTSGSRHLAEARLRAAGLWSLVPSVLVTAEDVANGKPDREPYILAAVRMHLDPRDCVVIEDAPAGITAARAAGMRVVALSTTYERACLSEAHVICDDLAEYRRCRGRS